MESSNTSSNECFNVTYLEELVITRTAIAGISFIFTTVVCFLSILRFCCKSYYTINQRLLIYLLIPSCLHSLAVVSQYIVLYYDPSNESYYIGCQAVGFFTLLFDWMIMIITFCISLHLLISLCQRSKGNNVYVGGINRNINDRQRVSRIRKKLEASYILLTTLGPLLFVFWPFLYGYYGLGDTHTWCFIEDHSKNCSGDDLVSIIEEIFLLYAWRTVLVIFSFVSIVLFILCTARSPRADGERRNYVTPIALLFYLGLHLLSTVVIVALKVLIWSPLNAYDVPLSFIGSILDSCRGLAAGIVVLVYLCYSVFCTGTDNDHGEYENIEGKTVSPRNSKHPNSDSELTESMK